MSVIYPAEPAKPYGDRIEAQLPELNHDEPFVPVYARRGKARGGQGKTWMILTPVAILVLGGIGAMLVLNDPEEVSAPLVEPAMTAPVVPVTPTDTAIAPLASASVPEPVATPPVVRDAAPLRRIAPAPARREAARAHTQTATAAPRVATPAPATPTGPQSYTPAPTAPTSTLNTAPATPTPTPPPPPLIIVAPAG